MVSVEGIKDQPRVQYKVALGSGEVVHEVVSVELSTLVYATRAFDKPCEFVDCNGCVATGQQKA